MSSFGPRDLALLLPDKVGETNSFSTNDDNVDLYEPLKRKLDNTKKVTRYFSGRAPGWINLDKSIPDHGFEIETTQSSHSKPESGFVSSAPKSGQNDNSLKISTADKRLARLSAVSSQNDGLSSGNFDNAVKPPSRRRVYEAAVILEANDSVGFQRDDQLNDLKMESIVAETSTVRENFLLNESTQESREVASNIISMLSSKQKSSDDESDDDETVSDEYSSGEDSSSDDGVVHLKPIFVPKHMRETIKEREKQDQEEEEKRLSKAKLEQERKCKTRVILAESIRRVEDAQLIDQTDADSDSGIPDDTDDPNDAIEFENWKIRELSRLKRDSQLREITELDKVELERRRKMTDEERLEEDRKLGIGIFKSKEKSKWNFLQRYYHKGAFYMDEDTVTASDDVRLREYAQPTGEDRWDKEKLPSVLQVKKFGMRGRTKYTHLADQDTTDFKTALKSNEAISRGYFKKMSGVGDIDAVRRPRKKMKSTTMN